MVYKALFFALFPLALTPTMAAPEWRSTETTQARSLPANSPRGSPSSFPTVRPISVSTTLIVFYSATNCHSEALGSKS